MTNQPGLFGLMNSNRDFTKKKYWGKNQFNSSFPAALTCYMGHVNINPVYLLLNAKKKVEQSEILVSQLFGLPALADTLHFSFESLYTPYDIFVEGELPRVDLVTLDTSDEKPVCLHPLEVKLTALPDDQTHSFSEDKYGCEIVVRPDTIVYLALSVAQSYRHQRSVLMQILDPVCSRILDWQDAWHVRPFLQEVASAIDDLLLAILDKQKPLLLQPVWKTIGKSPVLHENCFDLFVWSDFALTRVFVDRVKQPQPNRRMTRFERTIFWLAKMLYDFAQNGKFDPKETIDKLTYDTRNDKAFSAGGRITYKYMRGDVLTSPRVHKKAIREIIRGGGQDFLSPERRLDAVILNTPGLF